MIFSIFEMEKLRLREVTQIVNSRARIQIMGLVLGPALFIPLPSCLMKC